MATSHLLEAPEPPVAFELVLRPSAPASTEEPNQAPPSGCEEIWEHAVLRDGGSIYESGNVLGTANGASQDPLSWRSAALSLKAPQQVHALLEAIEEAREDGPTYVALATVVERTRSLSPRAKELAYAGHGPDSAFVIGWPSLQQLRDAFDAHIYTNNSSSSSSGSAFLDALLAKLPLDDPLWGELRALLDTTTNAGANFSHVRDGPEAAAFVSAGAPPRLRVSWHRPFADKTARQRLHDVHIRLEPAPTPAVSNAGTPSSSISSGHDGWVAARSEAWRWHLLKLHLLEEGSGGGIGKILEIPGGGAEDHGQRRRLTSGRGPEKSASEQAALPGSQGGIHLWFPVQNGDAVARVHDEAAALEARLEALEFGDISARSNIEVIKQITRDEMRNISEFLQLGTESI